MTDSSGPKKVIDYSQIQSTQAADDEDLSSFDTPAADMRKYVPPAMTEEEQLQQALRQI
jgi:hypothetical protein